jgi:hypothetical protein
VGIGNRRGLELQRSGPRGRLDCGNLESWGVGMSGRWTLWAADACGSWESRDLEPQRVGFLADDNRGALECREIEIAWGSEAYDMKLYDTDVQL